MSGPDSNQATSDTSTEESSTQSPPDLPTLVTSTSGNTEYQTQRPSRYLRAWNQLRKNKLAIVGLSIFLLVAFVAIFAEYLAPHDPTEQYYAHVTEPPSSEFLLGTDSQGRDILSRIIFGTRISLSVGIVAVTFAATVGTALGVVSGYEGGWVDDLIMRVIDSMMSIPVLVLGLALMATLGFGLTNVMIAVGIVYIPTFARLARGSTLSVKEKEYITAIESLGASRTRVLGKHILPNILSPILVQITLSMAFAILAEAGLSFLGLGTQPPTPSWGLMLSQGRDYLSAAPWIATFPGIAIMITILGLNTLGDGLRDILDPNESTTEQF